MAAICDDDTIMVDGARGASIRWKSFYPEGFRTEFLWKRYFALLLALLACFFVVDSY